MKAKKSQVRPVLRRETLKKWVRHKKKHISDSFFCINTSARHQSFWRNYQTRFSRPAFPDYPVHLLGAATLLPVSSHPKPSRLPEFQTSNRLGRCSLPARQSVSDLSLSHCPTSCWDLPRAAGAAAASLSVSSLHTAPQNSFLSPYDRLMSVLLRAHCNPRSFAWSAASPALCCLLQSLPQAITWPYHPLFQITISTRPDYFKKVLWFFFPKHLQSLTTFHHLSV